MLQIIIKIRQTNLLQGALTFTWGHLDNKDKVEAKQTVSVQYHQTTEQNLNSSCTLHHHK